VPGYDCEYEWVGFVPSSEMPYALNPKQGYIISTNQVPLCLNHNRQQYMYVINSVFYNTVLYLSQLCTILVYVNLNCSIVLCFSR